MELGSMKRKQLQALCKKHGIPANKSNLEMRHLLDFILNKPKEVDNENEFKDVSNKVRRVKKVRFSPETETREYEPSARKQMGRTRHLRSRQVVIEEEHHSERDLSVPKKRGNPSSCEVSQPEDAPVPSKTNLSKYKHTKAQDGGELGIPKVVRRSTRRRDKLEEKASLVTYNKTVTVAETETQTVEVQGNCGLSGSDSNALKRKSTASQKEMGGGIVAEKHIQAGRGVRRSRRNLERYADLEPTQQVVRRVTRSGAQTVGDDSAVEKESKVVQIVKESEGLYPEENSFKAMRGHASRKLMVPQKGQVGLDGLVVKRETRKRSRNPNLEVVMEVDASVESRVEIEKSSGHVEPLKRSRRNTFVPNSTDSTDKAGNAEAAGGMRQLTEQLSRKSVHATGKTLRSGRRTSIATSYQTDAISVDYGEAGELKRKSEPILERATSTNADESVAGHPPRRSRRHTSKSNCDRLSVPRETPYKVQQDLSRLSVIVEHATFTEEPSHERHGSTVLASAGDKDHVGFNCENVLLQTSTKKKGSKGKGSGTVSTSFLHVSALRSDIEKELDTTASLEKTCSPTSTEFVGASSGQEISDIAREPVVLNETEIGPNIVVVEKRNMVADRTFEDNIGDQSGRRADFAGVRSAEPELSLFQNKTVFAMSPNSAGASADQAASEIGGESFALHGLEKLVADRVIDKSHPLESEDLKGGLEEFKDEAWPSRSLNSGGAYGDKGASQIVREPLVLNEEETGPTIMVGDSEKDAIVDSEMDGQSFPLETRPDFVMDNSAKPKPAYFQIKTLFPTSLKLVGNSAGQKTSEITRASLGLSNEGNGHSIINDFENFAKDGIVEDDHSCPLDSRAGFFKDSDSAEVKLAEVQTQVSPTSPKSADAYMDEAEIAREEIGPNIIADYDRSTIMESEAHFCNDNSAELELAGLLPKDCDALSPECGTSSAKQPHFSGLERAASMGKECCRESDDASGHSAEVEGSYNGEIGNCGGEKTEQDITAELSHKRTAFLVEENAIESTEASFQADGNLLTPFAETGDQVSEVKVNAILRDQSYDVSEVSDLQDGRGIRLISQGEKDTNEAPGTVFKAAENDDEHQQVSCIGNKRLPLCAYNLSANEKTQYHDDNQLEGSHSSSVTGSCTIERSAAGLHENENFVPYASDIVDAMSASVITKTNSNWADQKDVLEETEVEVLPQSSVEEQRDEREVNAPLAKSVDDKTSGQENFGDCTSKKIEVKARFHEESVEELLLEASIAHSSQELVSKNLPNHKGIIAERKYSADAIIDMPTVSCKLIGTESVVKLFEINEASDCGVEVDLGYHSCCQKAAAKVNTGTDASFTQTIDEAREASTAKSAKLMIRSSDFHVGREKVSSVNVEEKLNAEECAQLIKLYHEHGGSKDNAAQANSSLGGSEFSEEKNFGRSINPSKSVKRIDMLEGEETKSAPSDIKQGFAEGTGDHLDELEVADGCDSNLGDVSINNEVAGTDKETHNITINTSITPEAQNGGNLQKKYSPFGTERLFSNLGGEVSKFNDMLELDFKADMLDNPKKVNALEMDRSAFVSSENLTAMETKDADKKENVGKVDGDSKFKDAFTDEEDYAVTVIPQVTLNGMKELAVEEELLDQSYHDRHVLLNDEQKNFKTEVDKASAVRIGAKISLDNIGEFTNRAELSAIPPKTLESIRKQAEQKSSEGKFFAALSFGKSEMDPSTGDVSQPIVSTHNGDKYESPLYGKDISNDTEVKPLTPEERENKSLEPNIFFQEGEQYIENSDGMPISLRSEDDRKMGKNAVIVEQASRRVAEEHDGEHHRTWEQFTELKHSGSDEPKFEETNGLKVHYHVPADAADIQGSSDCKNHEGESGMIEHSNVPSEKVIMIEAFEEKAVQADGSLEQMMEYDTTNLKQDDTNKFCADVEEMELIDNTSIIGKSFACTKGANSQDIAATDHRRCQPNEKSPANALLINLMCEEFAKMQENTNNMKQAATQIAEEQHGEGGRQVEHQEIAELEHLCFAQNEPRFEEIEISKKQYSMPDKIDNIQDSENHDKEFVEVANSCVPSKNVVLIESAEASALGDSASFGRTLECIPSKLNKENIANLCHEGVEEVIESSEDIPELDALVRGQYHSCINAAVGQDNAAADDQGCKLQWPQRTSSRAETEEGNRVLGKQLSSSVVKPKNQRTGLIQGTPQKVFYSSGMKENMPSIKRERIGDMTVNRTTPKRRALEDLRKN